MIDTILTAKRFFKKGAANNRMCQNATRMTTAAPATQKIFHAPSARNSLSKMPRPSKKWVFQNSNKKSRCKRCHGAMTHNETLTANRTLSMT